MLSKGFQVNGMSLSGFGTIHHACHKISNVARLEVLTDMWIQQE